MELRQIRSFIAVAHALSFSRAARQLHLSQPALSTQIKLLEAHLEAELLQRNRRTVQLTPAGEAFLADAEILVRHVAEMELRIARIAAGELGHIRIGFVASAALEIVPAVVLAFRKQYPRISLDLKNLPTVQQVEALRNGSIDAGFVRMPLVEEGLNITLIYREPFAIVLSKTHPLARKKDLTVKDLASEEFIAYGRHWAPSFYKVWTSICHDAGFAPNVVQETGEMSTALALVDAGLGVAILPAGMAQDQQRRTLAVKVLQREKIYSEIGIAVPAKRRLPLLDHLIATAKQVGKL